LNFYIHSRIPTDHTVADHFSMVIRFAGVCYGQFMAMRYKFNVCSGTINDS